MDNVRCGICTAIRLRATSKQEGAIFSKLKLHVLLLFRKLVIF